MRSYNYNKKRVNKPHAAARIYLHIHVGLYYNVHDTMARYTANEAADLLFEDQLVDSGDECEIEEDPAFPLPHEYERDELEDEPLPQTNLEMDHDLSTEAAIPSSGIHLLKLIINYE